ncbi:MAG: hypothetical protein RLY20_3227, partial [Verrucomicrobiota bacterium]
AQVIATNPTNLNATIIGNSLSLSWPADHIGWRLQAQTNGLSAGLFTNWFDLAGSDSTMSTNIPLDKAQPTVFFRLRSP